ncbi:imidazole glycerol phosphate synthase subunit HisH [Panacagrimonas sp.]|uniref:imidazole glycerol phosphate synthase subunit HisH n=1 Tax=Panacagrimonas sp. TaxID=2480088 RepID=UPI003B52DB86
MSIIGVIDYGMGNLHSLGKSLERVAGSDRIEISFDPEKLIKCDKLVLPGVGGVRGCMNELRRLELSDLVLEASQKLPMLGICLGMQVMLEFSEENEGVPALGLFPGEVVRFTDPPRLPEAGAERLKVPHMGWNRVHQTHAHPIWAGVPDDSWFYFVHSYYARPRESRHVIGSADYVHAFACAIARENLVAFQFHPEKSQGAGLRLLANFVQWDGTVPG